MTTSGTTTFNLDLNEAVEEAFERCGAELRKPGSPGAPTAKAFKRSALTAK